MTSKIFFDTPNELEKMFFDSGIKLEFEKDWFDKLKHIILFINLLLIFLCNNIDD